MKHLIKKIYPFVFFTMLLVLPFQQYIIAVPNIILLVLVGLFPIVIKKTDFKKLNRKPFILYFVFAIYLILNSVVLGRVEENLTIVLKVFFPLAIIFLYLPIQNLKTVNYGIIYSALAAIIFSVVKIGFLIYQTGTFEFGTGMNPVESLPTDRIYLGLLCLISIVISYKLLVERFTSQRVFHVVNISINILFLILIVSRMAILTLLLLLAIRFFYIRVSKKTFLFSLGAVVLVVALAFGLNSNMKRRFLLTTSNPDRSFQERLFLMEPRTKIWDCAIKIAPTGNELLVGLGFKTTIDQLVDCYEWNIAENHDRRNWYISQRYNTHNQFLDFYLSVGIFSALLFVGLFFLLFFRNRNNYFNTAILIAMFLFGFIESFFHRQVGAYYFGIILILLVLNKPEISKQTKMQVPKEQ